MKDVDVQRARSLCVVEVFHVHHTVFQKKVSRRTVTLVERVPSYLRQLGGECCGHCFSCGAVCACEGRWWWLWCWCCWCCSCWVGVGGVGVGVGVVVVVVVVLFVVVVVMVCIVVGVVVVAVTVAAVKVFIQENRSFYSTRRRPAHTPVLDSLLER